MDKLIVHCGLISDLFDSIDEDTYISKIEQFIDENKTDTALIDDLEFCVEAAKGKYALNYRYKLFKNNKKKDIGNKNYAQYTSESLRYRKYTITKFYDKLKAFHCTNVGAFNAFISTPPECRTFFYKLFRGKYPLLKKYKKTYTDKLEISAPAASKIETFENGFVYNYYQTFSVEERIGGMRCIAKYIRENNRWEFFDENGKKLNVKFDMSWSPLSFTWDGEIVKVKDIIHRKFAEELELTTYRKVQNEQNPHYIIYDLVDMKRPYVDRRRELNWYFNKTPTDISIMHWITDKFISDNYDKNNQLHSILEQTTANGAPSLLLRKHSAIYGEKNAVLEYKGEL